MGVSGTKARGELARLEPVKLREAWPNETADFTPWLAEPGNLGLLGETLGLQLEDAQTEVAVGGFSADVIATNAADDRRVLIENQLRRTDHGHLGQILTYAAGLDALTVIWIAQRFTDEHRAALEWLNNHTSREIQFFGLEIELWRIGDSPYAPKFNVVAKPNRLTKPRSSTGGLSETRQAQLDFWRDFSDHASQNAKRITPTMPRPQLWMGMAIGRTGFGLRAIASTWGEGAKPEVRAEVVIRDSETHYPLLERDRDAIGREFEGNPLSWYAPEEGGDAKIYVRREVDWRDRAERAACFEWLVKHLDELHRVFQPRIQKLG